MSNFLRYGWFSCAVFFLPVEDVSAQSLTIYSFPPPHCLNWRSPHTLLVSTLKNYYAKKTSQFPVRPIGHILVELKKDSISMFTAIVANDFSGLKQDLVGKKEGLTVLFKLIEGRLEESSALQAELAYRAKKGKVAFITYTISDTAFHYLMLYVDSFKLKGYDKKYNGNNHPRMGEGSGCSAFGTSFLELINALNQEDSLNWQVKVNVPQRLLGGQTGTERVRLRRLLFSFSWAKNNSACRPLVLFDPDLMYHWINQTWDEANKDGNNKYKLKKIDHAKGLEVDCYKCLPQTPMFKNYPGK